MRLRTPSLVIQITVWWVSFMLLFKILLCHHSLTHPSTPGQEHNGLHLTTMPWMISRSNGLKLWRTPIPSLFDDCWQRGRSGLKLSQVSLKTQGAEEEEQRRSPMLSLFVRLVSYYCQVGQTGFCNRSDRYSVFFRTSICNFFLFPMREWEKYCNIYYWMCIYVSNAILILCFIYILLSCSFWIVTDYMRMHVCLVPVLLIRSFRPVVITGQNGLQVIFCLINSLACNHISFASCTLIWHFHTCLHPTIWEI
jgi:hypothetical protein